MLSKKVDATLGAFWNYEGVDLAARPQDPVILRMDKLGVPTYNELILVARARGPRRGGRLAAAALPVGARRAGTRLLRDDPAVGVDALLKADKGLDRGLQTRRGRRRRCRSSSPPTPTKPFGWQDPADWAAYERWMRANKLLKRPPSRGAAADQRVPARARAGRATRP